MKLRLNPKEIGSDQRALARNHKIGFVFQNFNLLPRTSALENVAMPLAYASAHLSARETRRRAEEMLCCVGLQDRLDHLPSQLSGGQQQRVAIARALVNHPALLFADEPTGNLDSRTSEEVLQMFQQLNAQESITIVLVTHDANVARYAGRVITIHDGRSSQAEAFRTLRTNLLYGPNHERVRSLVIGSAMAGEGKTITAAPMASALCAFSWLAGTTPSLGRIGPRRLWTYFARA